MFPDGGKKTNFEMKYLRQPKKMDFKEHLSKHIEHGCAPLKMSFRCTLLS